MKTLAFSLTALPYYVPTEFDTQVGGRPKRKSLVRPPTSNRFVLPIRQSLVMDARLMPGTTRMLTLLAGWGGNGKPIDTNLSSIAKNLGRSVRQVQRYLSDAAEEGYLYTRKITNRFGYVIGLRITLCKAAIFAPKKKKPAPTSKPSWPGETRSEGRRKQGATQEADINENIYIYLDPQDPLDKKLVSLGRNLRIPIQSR